MTVMADRKQIEDFSCALSAMFGYSAKPQLFEPGETHFWDDSHISKSMLEAHLSSDNDAASRKLETISKTIAHLVSSNILKQGDKVLDLGCGPGLYSAKLCENGMKVTGIDISERSIDFAIRYAKEKGLNINYRRMDFFNISYRSGFDAVLQIYGELCTFSDEKRDELLAKIHKALKTDGLFIFDVSTRAQRMKKGLKNNWYMSDGGFWRPGKHFVLEQGLDYPEHDVWLDQYIVVDDSADVSVYRNWFHDYTLQSIRQTLEKADFQIIHTWNDLTGTFYEEGGDWIAIAGKKKNPLN